MVLTLSALSLMLDGSLTAGWPSAVKSVPSYDAHPSSANVAWTARAALMHGARAVSVWAGLIRLGVLKTKKLSRTVHATSSFPTRTGLMVGVDGWLGTGT